MVKKRRRPDGTRQRALSGGRKRVLVVLFVPIGLVVGDEYFAIRDFGEE